MTAASTTSSGRIQVPRAASATPVSLSSLPGPRGLPVLGSLVGFARDPRGFFAAMARRHGDRVTYRILEHAILQIGHPDDIEEVLVRRWRSFHKDAMYKLMQPLLGRGLVTAEEEEWQRHRKLIAPSFTPTHIRVYADAMVTAVRDYTATLRHGEERDLHADMLGLAQRIVLETLFGADLDVELHRVAESIEVFMEEFVTDVSGFRRLLPRAVSTPGRRRSARAVARLDAMIAALIAARRRAGLGADLLSRLLEARDETGRGLTDVEIRDEAITAFVAGHETTGLALAYTLGLIAENDAVDAALAAEAADVLGDRPATMADVARLPLTNAAIREGMRLLPPVWAIGRESMEEVEIGGVIVPPNTQVIVSQWVLHRDPRWFDDPLVFRPERWLDGLEDRLPRMAYIPFGAGPRICVGNHFALMEAVLLLAEITRTAGFKLTGKFPPRLIPSITLRPVGPIRAKVALRRSR